MWRLASPHSPALDADRRNSKPAWEGKKPGRQRTNAVDDRRSTYTLRHSAKYSRIPKHLEQGQVDVGIFA